MSERKMYAGLVRKSELTVEQVVDKIMEELDNTASIDWYDTLEDFINCEGDEKWFVINGVVYESELKEKTPYSSDVHVEEVEDGVYRVSTTFYNGVVSLVEMLELGFDVLKDKQDA